jgi:hypothetical protein
MSPGRVSRSPEYYHPAAHGGRFSHLHSLPDGRMSGVVVVFARRGYGPTGHRVSTPIDTPLLRCGPAATPFGVATACRKSKTGGAARLPPFCVWARI